MQTNYNSVGFSRTVSWVCSLSSAVAVGGRSVRKSFVTDQRTCEVSVSESRRKSDRDSRGLAKPVFKQGLSGHHVLSRWCSGAVSASAPGYSGGCHPGAWAFAHTSKWSQLKTLEKMHEKLKSENVQKEQFSMLMLYFESNQTQAGRCI